MVKWKWEGVAQSQKAKKRFQNKNFNNAFWKKENRMWVEG